MPEAPQWAPAYRAYAKELGERYHVPGFGVAMAKDGREIYAEGLGWRDRERELPVTPDTLFGIGSITKSFTCIAIMQLQERGRLRVTDPVVKYLPEFRTPSAAHTPKIALHHFMSHTSGLPPLPILGGALLTSMRADPTAQDGVAEAEREGVEALDTVPEMIAALSDLPYTLLGEPGTQFSYSNDGFALLGEVISRVSGEPYPEYVRRHILAPCGMAATVMAIDDLAGRPDVTTLYLQKEEDGKETVLVSPVWWDAPSMLAAGFLKSTPRDLLRYLEIYRTGGTSGGERILSKESVDEMIRPRITVVPGMQYGYGLTVTPYHGVTLVEHSGGLKGISAYISVVPELGLTAACLTNLAEAPAGQLLLGMLNGEMGLDMQNRRVVHTTGGANPPRDLLEACVGTYHSGESGDIVVALEGEGLTATAGGKRHALLPAEDGLFVIQMKDDQGVVRFLMRDGRAWAVAFGSRTVPRVADGASSAAG